MFDDKNPEQETDNFNIELKLSKEKRQTCREIVREIKNFGVGQRQIMYLIQLLAYELENRDIMILIADAIKKYRNTTPTEESSGLILPTTDSSK